METNRMKAVTKNRFLTIICCVFVVMLVIACGHNDNTGEFVLTNYLGSIEDEKEFVDSLRQSKEFADVSINESNQIVIRATDTQAEKWVNDSKKKFEEDVEDFRNVTGEMADYSDDYTVITFYMKTETNFPSCFTTIEFCAFYSELIQVFSGEPDWEININIVRPSDNKLLYHASYPKETININTSIWN